ncbi:MAG: hypothetical protein ABSD42_04505 [Candidatus Bathyarchaeia archaeon]
MTAEGLNFSDFEVQMLIIERNCSNYRMEQIDELLNRIGEAKGLQDAAKAGEKTSKPSGPSPAAVQELAFTALKWDPQQGGKIGDYEIATKAGNDPAKWTAAHEILSEVKATIKDRYHGQGYQYSYWLYDSAFSKEKIYRQKHKDKA